MAVAAGGGIKASANMWAVLADDDPGDSEVAKRHERETKVKEAAEYRHQQAVAAAAVGNNATRTHGRNQKKARKNEKKARNEKKAQKERRRKQRKKLQQPVAVANGDANTAVVVQAAEATVVGSDDEEESTSYCRTVIGKLLRAAVAAILIAFWVHAAAPAHTAT
ncbi:hypothetical protein BDA96_05G111800 [Sorghum bicolor]|uniref:Uncharacterized protein n=2 Tax=Sorghum bicolor TaxID=4558 RepID=A0A1Z5RIZ0_SORBI|nr:hypothetical protein BDA96_05G111800 [Sorghum bicolor]OQU83316.1 hypothetical protein SORBI_3005G107100 [Sorghum bicolor]